MRVLLVALACIVTAIGLGIMTETVDGVSTMAPIANLPVVCWGESETLCWLTIGAGTGILVVGIGGVGVVCLTLYGAGILFASGQVAAGGIALGQGGIGVTMFIGQAGGAFTALGQVAVGAIADGQGALGVAGIPFFTRLNVELNQILTPGPLPKHALPAPPEDG